MEEAGRVAGKMPREGLGEGLGEGREGRDWGKGVKGETGKRLW